MVNGERLKKARQKKGYTQTDLATITGVKQQMISKLEVGRANATGDIVRLAYALDVDPAWLEGISESAAHYTRRVSSRNSVSEKSIEPIFEFLKKEYGQQFEQATAREQAQIFMTCYDISLSAQTNKQSKKAMFTAMLKALKVINKLASKKAKKKKTKK